MTREAPFSRAGRRGRRRAGAAYGGIRGSHLATHSTKETLAFLEKLTGGPLSFARMIRSIREGDEETLAAFAARLGVSRQHAGPTAGPGPGATRGGTLRRA